MKIDVSSARQLACAPGDVAAFVIDPRNDVRWLEGVVSSRADADPLAVGTHVHRELRAKGHTMPMTFEVTRADPATGVAMRSLGDDDVLFDTAIEGLDDGTALVRLTVSGATRDGMVGHVLGREIEKGVVASLTNLAAVLDAAIRGG